MRGGHNKNGVYIKCTICGVERYCKRSRLREFNFCSHNCSQLFSRGRKKNLKPEVLQKRVLNLGTRMLGKKHSEATKKKISLASKGKPKPWIQGEKHYDWKGGVTPINKAIRHSFRYKEWRRSVFERDFYTCQNCGKIGGQLHADHIKPFAYFEELRFELSNGRTLCVDCHRLTSTFGARIKMLQV